MSFKLLSWNLNGIKKKFSSNNVQKIFKQYDIVAINESHLNIRDKCPPEFMLIGRSKPIKSLTPRGGVAVYKRVSSDIDLVVISEELRDCVIFKILPIDIVCIAVYIPPSNSKYYTPEYMDNLQLFLTYFKDTPTCIIGDLNARFGESPVFNDDISYKPNPDKIANTNGRTLTSILYEEKSFYIINGLTSNNLQCDSDFTFFSGDRCSQIDVALTNTPDIVSSFKILEKTCYSDHKPISITVSTKVKTQLNLVAACAADTFEYNHYDVNRKPVKNIKRSQLNVDNTVTALGNTAEKIKQMLTDNPDMDNSRLCTIITNEIYRCCKETREKKAEPTTINTLLNENCTSKNYYAIANANFLRYEHLMLEGKPEEDYKIYRDTWLEADTLACKHENQEYNIHTNEKWKNCKKNDGRRLWDAVDWKGKSIIRKSEEISAEITTSYFKRIFQSSKTVNNPTLASTIPPHSNNHVPDLDRDITIDDINLSIKSIGKGTSLDGISPDVMMILPLSMRKLLCRLYNNTFTDQYPIKWQQQLLFPHPKKGHKTSDPKLRGIAIAPVLSRIYDKILNTRFCNWYVPNKEQAGFRKSQGCLLQIFSIYLLMELSKDVGEELLIAFMDYEKAFDFMNRKVLIDKLTKKRAGNKFTRAVYNMYTSTSYTPKLSSSLLGEAISTEHGVTQGKVSSANLYSFYVSDMGECLRDFNEDFMDPINLCQLADDTATFATTLDSLSKKLSALFAYSDINYQVANIGKTKYLHLSNTPITDPIEINENEFIESAHKNGYRYLGTLFSSSNDIKDHILNNINDRKGQIYKFYAWLDYNMDTPIKVKLLVLYNCVFSSILYGAETWYDISTVSEDLLLLERQALRRCLGVKANTPNNLLYIETNRSDIVAVIRDRQYKFYKKVSTLEREEATIRNILDMCEHLDVINYYTSLDDNHRTNDLERKKECSLNANETYTKRYTELTGLKYCHALYETYLREDLRILITRWRMSCLQLEIETGRYHGVPRENRICRFCDVLEDESHAIYSCVAYDNIRKEYKKLLDVNHTVNKFLNPKDKSMATEVGIFLSLIQEKRESLLAKS